MNNTATSLPIHYRSGITGSDLRRVMWQHGVSIKELAQRMGNTMLSIRAARRDGVQMPGAVDYVQAIVGEFTPELRAVFLEWRENCMGRARR